MGDGLITFDSETRLEWLDVTENLGRSYDSILLSTFVTSQGFSFATTDDVSTLYTNAGIVSFGFVPVGDGFLVLFLDAKFSAAALLIDLLGCTGQCARSQPIQEGLHDFSPFSATISPASFIQSSSRIAGRADQGRALVPASSFLKSNSSPVIGGYLIRQTAVPEPAALLLFGVGLAGLAGIRRRRQAR